MRPEATALRRTADQTVLSDFGRLNRNMLKVSGFGQSPDAIVAEIDAQPRLSSRAKSDPIRARKIVAGFGA